MVHSSPDNMLGLTTLPWNGMWQYHTSMIKSRNLPVSLIKYNFQDLYDIFMKQLPEKGLHKYVCLWIFFCSSVVYSEHMSLYSLSNAQKSQKVIKGAGKAQYCPPCLHIHPPCTQKHSHANQIGAMSSIDMGR